MFINRIIQELLSLTPFVSTTKERFYKSADKEGFLSRIPLFGSLLNVVPPLKWIDSKFKYPLLTIGRILVCGFVIWNMINFSLYNENYKSFVNNQVINRILPAPIKAVVPEAKSGNFILDGFENQKANAANETTYLIESAKNGTSKGFLREFFYGATAVIVRAPILYLLYSLLFFLFGNTTAQQDAKALARISGVRQIGEVVVKNIASFLPQDKYNILQNEFKSLPESKRLYDKNYQQRVVELLNLGK